MIFKFAKGYQFPAGMDPSTVGERLTALRGELGTGFTKSSVVADAAANPTPYGDYFEWDDAVAGSKYREEQAGYLIRAIVVVRESEDEKPPREERAFVSVVERESSDDRYMPIYQALSDDEYRAQLVERYWLEAWSWRQRAAEMAEFSAIFRAIDRVAKQRANGMESVKKAA